MDQEPQGTGNFDAGNWQYETLDVTEQFRAPEPIKPPPKKRRFSLRALQRGAIILAACSLVLSIVIGAYLLLRKSEKKPPGSFVVNTQSLDNGTLNSLTDQADGNVKQQLTISPDTLFKNSVVVQGSLSVEKDLTVRGKTILQGPANLSDGLTVAKNTAIAGNLNVNGQISAASLTVGSLTISSINLSSNLNFAGHIVPSGAAPATRPSVAAGSGTVTISGNDTAGTVVITVSGFVVPGELAIITFRTAFSTTPKVQLTPINDSASALNYFATRSASFFTINTASNPISGQTYVFDYLITQ